MQARKSTVSYTHLDVYKRQKYGSYNVYGIDRSVCDCIRFREDIDKDIFELVIENYRKYDKKNEERLMAYAKAMRIGRQVERIGLDR